MIAVEMPEFGDLKQSLDGYSWSADIRVGEHRIKLFLFPAVHGLATAQRQARLRIFWENAAPRVKRVFEMEPALRAQVISMALPLIADWHLPEEGKIDSSELDRRMKPHGLVVSEGEAGLSLSYLVEARPSDYEITAILDDQFRIEEIELG